MVLKACKLESTGYQSSQRAGKGLRHASVRFCHLICWSTSDAICAFLVCIDSQFEAPGLRCDLA